MMLLIGHRASYVILCDVFRSMAFRATNFLILTAIIIQSRIFGDLHSLFSLIQYIPHFIQYGLVLGRPATKVRACGSESIGIVRCLPSS